VVRDLIKAAQPSVEESKIVKDLQARIVSLDKANEDMVLLLLLDHSRA